MLPQLKSALRRSARVPLARVERSERGGEIVRRARYARTAYDPNARRVDRDDHATRVVLASVLRKDSSAIDVGANRGEVLELIVRLAPDGRHIAFEPLPALHEHLAANFPQVDVRRSALSDVAETTEFSHVVNRPAYSGLLRRSDLPADAGSVEQIQVRTERLDDVLADAPPPTLIKVDVEGAEVAALRGAADTLARHRPYVLFEHGAGGADLYGAGPTELFELLDGAGLRIFDLDGDGPYSAARFEETFAEPIWNFLAVPA